MNAVLYARCSSITQTDGDSFERQADTIHRFATLRKLTLVNCFFEAITGTSDDRPAFNAMLDWCTDNGATHILIERMDRLARKFSVGETLIAMCQQRGLTIIDCSTSENLTDDNPSPDAWLNASFRLLVAEWEKRNLVYRTTQAKARIRAAKGKCDGRKGYHDDPKFPLGPQIIGRAKSLRAAHHTYEEIATLFNNDNIPTINGGHWHPNTIRRILRRTHDQVTTYPS